MAALLITTGGVLAVVPARAVEGTPVAVVLGDLPTGGLITAAVVRDQRVADPPDGSASAAEVIGRTVAGPVRRGEVLTDARLVAVDGPDPGPDRVAVPVRLDDPGVVALLRPGLHVAVLAVNPDGSDGDPEAPPTAETQDPGPSDGDATWDDRLVTVLAADAVVLTVPTAGGASPLRPGAGAGTVLIAVPHETADAVAGRAALGSLTIRFT